MPLTGTEGTWTVVSIRWMDGRGPGRGLSFDSPPFGLWGSIAKMIPWPNALLIPAYSRLVSLLFFIISLSCFVCLLCACLCVCWAPSSRLFCGGMGGTRAGVGSRLGLADEQGAASPAIIYFSRLQAARLCVCSLRLVLG